MHAAWKLLGKLLGNLVGKLFGKPFGKLVSSRKAHDIVVTCSAQSEPKQA